jgi:predicted permease
VPFERWTSILTHRLRSLVLRGRVDRELDDEIQDHLARQSATYIAQGMTPDEARRAALRRFGGVEQWKEDCRDARGVRVVHDLIQDLRYGARLLRRSPGFTAVALISLALGIGANTAILQLIDAVRLRLLPVENPRELAIVRVTNQAFVLGNFGGRYADLTYPQWEQLRASQQAFSDLAAWSSAVFDLASRGESRFAENALWVSGGFFDALGVRPAHGRLFSPADDTKGCGSPGVVLSHAFWLREFAGDPSIVGRPVTVNGHSLDVIGVTAPGFFGVEVGRSFDLAVPLCADGLINRDRSRLEDRSAWWLAVMGRRKPGWSVAQSDAHLVALSPALFRETLPAGVSSDAAAAYLGFTIGAETGASGYSRLRQEYDTPLLFLLGVAGIVLLIACANLANLLLARAGAREREMAVRLAIGASRGRLMRQLLTESLLLSTLGAVLGGVLARVLIRTIVDVISSPVNPLFVDLRVDWRLLAVTAGLAGLTCVLFGLLPAARGARIAPGESMKSGGRVTTGRAGLRRILVAAQVALSLVLLVAGLLFVRSLVNLLTVDTGFRQDGILEADVDLTRIDLPPEHRLAFRRDLLDRVRAIPEVDGAATASTVPMVGNWWRSIYADSARRERQGHARFNRISSGYFTTLGTAFVDGRDFDDRDTPGSPPVAIVNESFAARFVGRGSPRGATFRLEGPTGTPEVVVQIVAVVRDSKYGSLREDFGPIVYLAASQLERAGSFDQILIRSRLPLAALMPSVSRALDGAHARISFHFHDFREQIRYSLLRDRLMANLCGFFAALAVILSTIGVYGVMSYSVAQRTSEIGVRLALGASRRSIFLMILREAVAVVGFGVGTGLVLALMSTNVAREQLFGLQPSDPTTLGVAVLVLAAAAAAASYFPARRAANADPLTALRCD